MTLEPYTHQTRPHPDYVAESRAIPADHRYDGWPNLATCRLWDWLAGSTNNAEVDARATRAAIDGDIPALAGILRRELKARRRGDLLALLGAADLAAVAKELVEIGLCGPVE